MRLGLDRTILLHHLVTERREPGATAGRSSVFCLDDRRLEKSVELVDQQPGATVRHAHRAASRRNRSVVADGFKQLDLAVAYSPPWSEVETQREPRHAAKSNACARGVKRRAPSERRFNVEGDCQQESGLTPLQYIPSNISISPRRQYLSGASAPKGLT
jgi:hypothetical protein